MINLPFGITAAKQGNKAIIRITGTIGVDLNAEQFRAQVESIAKEGVTDAHIYINSPGGSTFDAAEIVNIIRAAFTGQITGEGRALVASAATYIALQCKAFTMPENGMYMIHKPSGKISGDARDLESYLKLLQKIESQYYAAYKKVAKDADAFDRMWNSGVDWWMTADEAKINGFISGVRGAAEMDERTAAMIAACGCPAGKLPGKTTSGNDLVRIAEALKINAESTLDDILKEIARLQGEERPEDMVRNALTRGTIQAFESEELLMIARTNTEAFARLLQKRTEHGARAQREKITRIVSDAIYQKRIVATAKAYWETLLSTDYAAAHAALMELEPVEKIPFKASGCGTTVTGKSRANWTLDDYRRNDPKALRDDPDLYDRLIEKEHTNKKR